MVSFANLDNSGGGDLYTAQAGGTFPALLEAPAGAAAPTITGGSTTPTALGCTQGIWGPDLRESLLYRAPQRFSFSWFRNGAPVNGAAGSLLQAMSPGSYTCHVTAQNFAGSSSQSSAPFAVAPPPPPPSASATASTSGSTASISVTCHGVTGQVCAGGLTLTTRTVGVRAKAGPIPGAVGVRGKGGPRPGAAPVSVGSGSYRAAAGATVTVPIALNPAGRRMLGRLFRLPTTLAFSGTTAPPRVVTFSLARIQIDHHLLVWRIVVGSYTTASSLSVQPVPRGATVGVVCLGRGCPFRHRSVTARRLHVSLTGLFGRHHLRPGTRVTFEITASRQVGERLSYILQARGTVRKPTIMCVAPGSRRAVTC